MTTLHQMTAVAATTIVVVYACLAARHTSALKWKGQRARLAAISGAYVLFALGVLAYTASLFDGSAFDADTACLAMMVGGALFLASSRRKCVAPEGATTSYPASGRRAGEIHTNYTGGAAL